MTSRHAFLFLLIVLAVGERAAAQSAAPPPPTEYTVQLRYSLARTRNLHVAQFDAMMAFLKSVGFHFTPEEGTDREYLREDPNRNVLTGTIASANARKLLTEPHVRSVLLVPAEAKLPAALEPVRVQLELALSANVAVERTLADQIREVLKGIGFREAVGYDNRGHSRLVGMIPAGQLPALLNDLRLQPAGVKHLKQVLLRDGRLYGTVVDMLGQLLDDLRGRQGGADAVRGLLKDLGRNPAGMDLPYDELLKTQDALLAELRRYPAGADLLESVLNALPRYPAGTELLETLFVQLRRSPTLDLPVLYKSLSPLLVTEALPGVPTPKDVPPPPKFAGNPVIGPDLRPLLADAAEAVKSRRLEIILSYRPSRDDRTWQAALRQASPALVIEGHLGPLVTVVMPLSEAPAVAAVLFVSTIRLPRSGQPHVVPQEGGKAAPGAALQASGLVPLHTAGARGQGVRVAVIDGDFRGWQEQIAKRYPATKLLDLTAERNASIEADPFPGDPKGIGHGTACVLALLRAAPEAALTLIRIDPEAPYQLQAVARAINGEQVESESLDLRVQQLEEDSLALKNRRLSLLEERRRVFDKYTNIKERDLILAKPDAKRTPAERELLKDIQEYDTYLKKQEQFNQDERAYQQRVQRLLDFRRDLASLRGIRVVANSLIWNEGHPVDGGSALSRYFDDRPFRAALWFQSVGNTRGQSWAGLFRDVDGNGVMEFDEPDRPLRRGRWARELNFLGWQAAGDKQQGELPAGTRVRVSVQWCEAHDAEFFRNGEDLYREPLAEVRLLLLRQRDPNGTKLAADDLEVVAYSAEPAQRLDNRPAAAVYEKTLEFTVAANSVYTLRVEGRVPSGTRPPSVPTLPAMRQVGELRPRIFIQTVEGAGRAVFVDYAPVYGGLGVPCDAHQVITVGAADLANQPEPASERGAPYNQELLAKPDVLAYDQLGLELSGGAQGASLAANFAAGVAASAISAGAPRGQLLNLLRVRPGGVLRVPAGWPGKSP